MLVNNFKVSDTVFVKWLNDEGTYDTADFDCRCLKYD